MENNLSKMKIRLRIKSKELLVRIIIIKLDIENK